MKPAPMTMKFGKAARRPRIYHGDGYADSKAPMPQGPSMATLIAERKTKTRGTP